MDSAVLALLVVLVVSVDGFGEGLGLFAGEECFADGCVLGDVGLDELVHGKVEHVVFDGQVAASSVDVQLLLVVDDDDSGAEEASQVVERGLERAVGVQGDKSELALCAGKGLLNFSALFLGFLGGLLELSARVFRDLLCLVLLLVALLSCLLFTRTVDREAGQTKL